MKNTLKRYATAAVLATATAAALAPSVSQAVTPDQRLSISGYWSFPRAFHEWFDWRSYAGWGTVGAVNAAAIALYGGSSGDVTTASFSALCGATASGVLATWKPASEPTAASHIKAIVKAGGVVAASSACSWISKTTFGKVNNEIPRAQNYINNNMTASAKQDLSTAVGTLNNAANAADTAFHTMSNNNEQLKAVWRAYNLEGCDKNPGGDQHIKCVTLLSTMTDLAQRNALLAKQILQYGDAVKLTANVVNDLIKT